MTYPNTTSLILLLFAALFLSGSFVSANSIRGQAAVIDGDALEIHGKRIRLHGIDAPESDQICRDKNAQNLSLNYVNKPMINAY